MADGDTRFSMETTTGFHDGIALLNRLVATVDAPEGNFQDLLSAPHYDLLGG
jgi:hypothetical protein